MPDKLRAVEQLAKLCGWNEPEKFEHRRRRRSHGGPQEVERRFAWIVVPPTVEAYLGTSQHAEPRRGEREHHN